MCVYSYTMMKNPMMKSPTNQVTEEINPAPSKDHPLSKLEMDPTEQILTIA